jgi:hypothetical protein
MLLGDFYTTFLAKMIVLPSRTQTPHEVGHLNPWRLGHHAVSKFWAAITQWHGDTQEE